MQVTISFEKPAHTKSGGLAQKAAEVRDAAGAEMIFEKLKLVLVHMNKDRVTMTASITDLSGFLSQAA